MKVIQPTFEILTALEDISLVSRIEQCGRICYKSEDKIDLNSAEPFVKKVINYGHNSVLEMGVITLEIVVPKFIIDVHTFLESDTKYLFINRLGALKLLITGSIRSFREYCQNNSNFIRDSILDFLQKSHPIFYSDVKSGNVDVNIKVRKVRLNELLTMNSEIVRKHYHIAVKFITNRAVTHELVRHRPVSYLQESQRYCRYDKDQFGNEVTFIKPVFYNEDSPEYNIWKTACEETEKLYLKLLETSSPQAARTVLPNSCKTEIITYCNFIEWSHLLNLRTSKAAEPSMREIMEPLLIKFKEKWPELI